MNLNLNSIIILESCSKYTLESTEIKKKIDKVISQNIKKINP